MKRHVCTLIRLIAAGLIVFGGMEIGLEFVRKQVQRKPNTAVRPAPLNIWRIVFGSVLLVSGTALFVASPRLAEKFTEDFDE